MNGIFIRFLPFALDSPFVHAVDVPDLLREWTPKHALKDITNVSLGKATIIKPHAKPPSTSALRNVIFPEENDTQEEDLQETPKCTAGLPDWCYESDGEIRAPEYAPPTAKIGKNLDASS